MQMTIAGTAEDVRQAMRSLMASPLMRELDENARADAEIVLAEAMNNIVEHAYAGTFGEIDIMLELRSDGLHCQITDAGHPMPELSLPAGRIQTLNRIEDLPEGGFGWFLIRSLTEGLEYGRSGNRNRLSFMLPRQQSDG